MEDFLSRLHLKRPNSIPTEQYCNKMGADNLCSRAWSAFGMDFRLFELTGRFFFNTITMFSVCCTIFTASFFGADSLERNFPFLLTTYFVLRQSGCGTVSL